MNSLILLLLIIPGWLFGVINWEGKAENQFSAAISLSAQKLTLDERLFISVILTYPGSYSIDTDRIRVNLLKYAGLSEPPFALLFETEEKIQGGKKLTFTLDPLRRGIHFLSLYDIQFDPKDEKMGAPVSIISNIFEVETSFPDFDPKFQGIIYPLLSLTKRFPLSVSLENRLDLLENPALQAQENLRNMELMREKTFPLPPVMGVFVFMILLLIARMQPKKEPNIENLRKKEVISSKRRALHSLELLGKKELSSLNAIDSYFVILSETVRKYIEESYQIRATTRTTVEFLEQIAKNPAFDENAKEILQRFLISSDKVKFADYVPSKEECESALKMAKQLIEHASSAPRS